VGPRAGLERCGKSRHHRYSIPEPSSPQEISIPTEVSWPTFEPGTSRISHDYSIGHTNHNVDC